MIFPRMVKRAAVRKVGAVIVVVILGVCSEVSHWVWRKIASFARCEGK